MSQQAAYQRARASARPLVIRNARAITPRGVVEHAWVSAAEGRIAGVGQGEPPAAHAGSPAAQLIDAEGLYLSPGFIDIHVHGGGGHDFMDATPEAFLGAAREHGHHGTTSMVPTTVAAGADDIRASVAALEGARRRIAELEGAEGGGASGAPALLGMHIEGPYLAMAQRGAQDARYLRNPNPDEYLPILNSPEGAGILRWTAAPELPGGLELGRHLRDRGILPSIGHSDATCEEAEIAFAHGYRHITHLYSCMSTVKRVQGFRYAGVLEAAYLIDDLTVELIADGCHLPATLLRLAYKLKGPSRIALVTDAIRAAGLPPGESVIGSLTGGQPVIVEDGVAKLPDRSAFAGSVATTDRLVRTMVALAGVPLVDAVRMMSLTPAEVLGIDHQKGSLEVGKDADLLLFDDSVSVKLVVAGGAVLSRTPSAAG